MVEPLEPVGCYITGISEFVDATMGRLTYLSDDELLRAAAIARTDNRARFLAGRYALRTALASILAIPAREVPIKCYEGPLQVDGAYCSLAHSRDLALVAVSRNHRVGVDIQYVRPRLCRKLAMQLGWHALAEWMTSRNRTEQAVMFTRVWTRAEALLKALSMSELPLDWMDLTAPFGDLHSDRIVLTLPIGHVSITDLVIDSGYAAALVTCTPLDVEVPSPVLKVLVPSTM